MEPVLPFELSLAATPRGRLAHELQRQLRAAALDGRLPAGYALPSTRLLAAALGLGRNTVIAAYDTLVAEGLARARAGARLVLTPPAPRAPPSRAPSAAVGLSAPLQRPTLPRLPPTGALPDTHFRVGVPEHRGFPHAVWRRLAARTLRAAERQGAFRYGGAQGLPALREAIAGHAAHVRAVACSADTLIVTAGAQQAFDLLARVLVVPGRTQVAVEEPGYPPLRAAFAAAGARLVPVPVDDDGLCVDRIPRHVSVVAVTPSHQSPTGVSLSPARRQALLARAQALDAAIVEDDYDGEFLAARHPPDALQTLDRDGRVFYVGSFSKSLFPGLRLGYLAAPAWALDALLEARRWCDLHGPLQTQALLAAFIAEGHLARHLRRMRRVYAERREALVDAMQRHLGGVLQPLPPAGGLHLCARIVDPALAPTLWTAAQRHLPGVLPLQAYALTPHPPPGLVLGFGAADVPAIEAALRRLAREPLRRT